jgi:excisionase family DNA binding protein
LAALPAPNEQLLTVSQVAEQLQVTAQTIRNWIDGGVLPAARIGRGFRIRRQDVDELLARASAQGGSLATAATSGPRQPRRCQAATSQRGPQSVWEDAGTPLPLRRS